MLGVELQASEDDIRESRYHDLTRQTEVKLIQHDIADKAYRKKSLMIHPDRFKAARGPEAFDLLKKAQTDLSNPDKRK